MEAQEITYLIKVAKESMQIVTDKIRGQLNNIQDNFPNIGYDDYATIVHILTELEKDNIKVDLEFKNEEEN